MVPQTSRNARKMLRLGIIFFNSVHINIKQEYGRVQKFGGGRRNPNKHTVTGEWLDLFLPPVFLFFLNLQFKSETYRLWVITVNMSGRGLLITSYWQD